MGKEIVTVNAATGEIVTVDRNEASVVAVLQNARDMLAEALTMSGPEAVAYVKAQIATAATFAKELHLSKEIQLDAQEMVRRAEYALGKAIREGQAEGTVAGNGQHLLSGNRKASESFASKAELHGDGRPHNPGILAMADEADDDTIDAAIDEAKAEGNLSRANVVRKVRGQTSTHVTREQRATTISALAFEGMTSRQIGPKVGVSAETVRQIARDFDIDIPADRVTARRHGLNAMRVLSGTAEAVEVAVLGLQQIDPLELDQEAAQEWIDSLTESSKALSKAIRQIKESFHVQD